MNLDKAYIYSYIHCAIPTLQFEGFFFLGHSLPHANFIRFSFPAFFFFFLSFVVVVVVAISWAAPAAYGSSPARGPIGAVAAGLHQSHSNAGSEPHLQPAPQLTAMLDP